MPSYRPWRYLGGPEPDSWWCQVPTCSQNPDPLVTIQTELALYRQLGIANLRLEFPWRFLEPSDGVYDWSRADAIVQAADTAGITIQPILVYTPAWANSDPTGPPTAAQFSQFVTAIVSRYHASIHDWELWNEPNLVRYWSGSEQDYVSTILVPGYQAVHAADPSAQVLLGGPYQADTTWLEGIYSDGGEESFDIMAFHDYTTSVRQIFTDAGTIQSLLDSHGQGAKPIWLGEYGVQEDSLQDSQQQALMQGVLTGSGPIALAQWYNLRDDYSSTCCPPAVAVYNSYGLVQHDDTTLKAGFATMQSLLGGTSPTATPTRTTVPTATSVPPTSTPVPATPTATSTTGSSTVEDTYVRANQMGWGTSTPPSGMPAVTWGMDGSGSMTSVDIASNTGSYAYPGATNMVGIAAAGSSTYNGGDSLVALTVSAVGHVTPYVVQNACSDKSCYYAARLHTSAGMLELAKRSGNTTTILTSVPFTTSPNTLYWMRLDVQVGAGSDTLAAKVWADGTSEPTSWMVAATDSSPLGANLQGAGGSWDQVGTGESINYACYAFVKTGMAQPCGSGPSPTPTRTPAPTSTSVPPTATPTRTPAPSPTPTRTPAPTPTPKPKHH